MNQLITDRHLLEIEVDTFTKRRARLHVDERRWVWASWQTWASVLVVPQPMHAKVLANAGMAAGTLNRRRSQPFQMPHPSGEPWFRWHALRAALAIWHETARRRIPKGDATVGIDAAGLTHDEAALYRNYIAICDWGDDLQEQALAGALTAPANAALASSPTTTDRLQQAMVLLVGEQFAVREQLGEHSVRLLAVEQKVQRDPNEFISTRKFAIEAALYADQMLPGMGIGIAGWLGNYLSKQGVEMGPKVAERLPDSSRVTWVNTYRRAGLEDALKKAPTK